MKLTTTFSNDFLVTETQYHDMQPLINDLANLCYGSALAGGWYNKHVDNGTRFMLMVSEIAEAMEGDRKDMMDDHLPDRKMVEVELADCMIRILDFCGRNSFDIGGAFAEKFHYNQRRADHKLENRMKPGGKKY